MMYNLVTLILPANLFLELPLLFRLDQNLATELRPGDGFATVGFGLLYSGH